MTWITSVLGVLIGGVGGFLTVAAMEYLGGARSPTPISVVRAMTSVGALAGLACAAAVGGSSPVARRRLDFAVPTLAAAVGLCLGLDGAHLLMRAFGYEALEVPSAMSGEQLILSLVSLLLAIPRTLVSSLFFWAVATGAWSWFRRRRWNEDVSWPPARLVRITLAFSGVVALALVIATLIFYHSCWGTTVL